MSSPRATTLLRIGELRDSSLVARRLAPVRRVLCGSPDYLRRHGTPQHPADLLGHRILHYGWQASGTRWHFRGPEGEAGVEVPVALCVNNGEVLCAAAVAGHGVVLLPTFIVGAELQLGRLVRVLPEHEPTPLVLHALWPANRLLPTRVRAFVDFLVARFGDRPHWDLVS
jgi:DNA-binding transcriptional LysR family regulator